MVNDHILKLTQFLRQFCVCVYICTHTHIHTYTCICKLTQRFHPYWDIYGISNEDTIIIFKVSNFKLLTFYHRCNCQAQCLLVKVKSVVSILFRLLVWKFKVFINAVWWWLKYIGYRLECWFFSFIHIWTQGY